MNAQNITFIEQDESLPAKYCEFSINNNIYYSDSFGVFKIQNQKKGLIKIDNYKYEPLNFFTPTSDTIVFLKQRKIALPPIEIKPRKESELISKAKKNAVHELKPGYELGILTPKICGTLKEISFETKKLQNDKNLYFKLDFYKKNENDFDRLNYENIILPISEIYNHKIINIKLKEYGIYTCNAELLIAIRLISNIGNYDNEKISDNSISIFGSKERYKMFIRKNHHFKWKEMIIYPISFKLKYETSK
ncbi:hypothetical protein EDM00_00975 [Ornithobacterium rhinotracheale]|uniref:hypothetical protein n=1 Tax=Ornithobacterium rhinotracheale TaxID=28251 RepID=UPI001629B10C|nr:hypothetical protein [Ornithobacterium rhinotracheale]MRI62574.1 hypothetical protein [Ornithobacterium rhinotracheale]